jgi:Tol biopolymer transport system component
MSTRVSDEYYMFWSEHGELFKAKTLEGVVEPIQVKANNSFSPRWYFVFPNVYWLDFTSSQIVLMQFNLNGSKKRILDKSAIHGVEFSMSLDGDKFVLDGLSDVNSNLYVIDNII